MGKLQFQFGLAINFTPLIHPGSHFITAAAYVRAVLGVVVLSVCLSICHVHALWQN